MATTGPPVDYDKKADAKSDRDLDGTAPADDISLGKGDILQLESTDPVLNAKMHLVNNAIDEIGFSIYQWKLFVLNGFGYAVDSLILLIQSIIAGQAALEFSPGFANGLTIAAYVGMLTGALFWGLTADIVGRKFAFNFSLLVCSVFAIVAGGAPNWEVLGLFVALSAFGGGGNLVLDTAVFLEFLPSGRQWMLTLMAAWWGEYLQFRERKEFPLYTYGMLMGGKQVSASSSPASSPGPSSPDSPASTQPWTPRRRPARAPTTWAGATCGSRRARSSSS